MKNDDRYIRSLRRQERLLKWIGLPLIAAVVVAYVIAFAPLAFGEEQSSEPWECTERGTAVFGHRGPVSAQDLLDGQELCKRRAALVEQAIRAGA